MTTDMWDCEAYGPKGTEIGVLCFFADHGERECADLDECHRAMAEERQRVFRRMNELAARGDEAATHLAGEFTHPEQLLGGGEGYDPKDD